MGNEEPREPAAPGPVDPDSTVTASQDDNDLSQPVAPPSRPPHTDRERHLTRRVIAPAVLLLVSVPVVALLFLNVRSVPDDSPADSDTTPSSQTGTPSASSTPSASASSSPPTTPPTRSPSPVPEPTGPSIEAVSSTSGPAAGGQTLTVRGNDLDAVTQVLFGALSGLNLQHVSSTEIRVTTPVGDPGQVELAFRSGADEVPADRVSSYTYR